MKRLFFKLSTIFALFGLMIFSHGCGGGRATTGSVSGKVIFGVQPASLSSKNSYPVIPLNQNSRNIQSASLNSEKIIKFRSGLGENEIAKIVSGMGGRLKHKIYGTENSYVVDMGVTHSSLKITNYDSNIESIADNVILHASEIPNDTSYDEQWGCQMMYFPEAWDIQKGTSIVTVAVLDTGILTTHEDLDANLIIPTDRCNFTVDKTDPLANNPMDDSKSGHGTHVAGIINAVSDNNTGVAGMAWNVKILPVKVLDYNGSGNLDQLIAGINYAVYAGVDIINVSLGATGMLANEAPPDFINAVNNAKSQNVTIIAATGNENGPVNFPANYPGIIAVGALGPDGQRASYSNYGPEVFVCAPGGVGGSQASQYILSTSNKSINSYAYMSGTSMAAPHISGLVALLYSQKPNITPGEVRNKLQSFTIDKGTPGFDNYCGYGMPDAYAVLSGRATRLSEIAVYVVSTEKVIQMSQYPDGLGNYNISGISPGAKYICAFLDKNRNGQVDSGDLFGYQTATIQAGTTVSSVNITLTDVQIIDPAPSLANYLKAETVLP